MVDDLLKPDALLVLGDGLVICGKAFGDINSKSRAFGEIVFNTAMTGYQETLTDPSYHQQIVIQTTPHIGNTGTNLADDESARIWVAGYVVRELSEIASSWRSEADLNTRLSQDGILGIQGVDTRYLTRHLRTKGVMKSGIFAGALAREITENYCIGEIVPSDKVSALISEVNASKDMQGAHLAPEVSTATQYTVTASETMSEFGFEALHVVGASSADGARADDTPIKHSLTRTLRVVSVDLGIKKMTPKLLCARGKYLLGENSGVEVINVPLNTSYEEIKALRPDGIFFSNGPGDPGSADIEIDILRSALRDKLPFFGICMGNQMLGRALGFDTYKLSFGHRGVNQPIKDLNTGSVTITAHNHGFAVDLPLGELDEFGAATNPPIVTTPYNNGEFGRAQVSHISLNDNCVEGIKLLDLPAFSVQYHPEAAAGPHDAVYLFDKFIEQMVSSADATGATPAHSSVQGEGGERGNK